MIAVLAHTEYRGPQPCCPRGRGCLDGGVPGRPRPSNPAAPRRPCTSGLTRDRVPPMSMRTTLTGCTLAKIRRAIGTADEKLIKTVRSRVARYVRENYEAEIEEPDDADLEELRGQLETIVAKLKGEPAVELDDEGEVGHVVATALLKRADGSRAPTTPFEVKHAYWDELLHRCAAEMGADEPLFQYLSRGRPLFGRTNQGRY